jgi:hypothetical protein
MDLSLKDDILSSEKAVHRPTRKRCAKMNRSAFVARITALGLAISATFLPIAAVAAPAAVLCRNTTSGSTWTITVDPTAATVDGLPARITQTLISWKDTDGHFYDLHRATGVLEMHVASSTGGFYLMDRCAAAD